MAENTADTASQRKRSPAQIRATVVGLLATVIKWIGLLFAVVLVVYILLVIGKANSGNGIYGFFKSWADSVSFGFKDLFTPKDGRLRVLVNYGIAAIFWLVITNVAAKIVTRVGSAASS